MIVTNKTFNRGERGTRGDIPSPRSLRALRFAFVFVYA
jgi:hypothetical protein